MGNVFFRTRDLSDTVHRTGEKEEMKTTKKSMEEMREVLVSRDKLVRIARRHAKEESFERK